MRLTLTRGILYLVADYCPGQPVRVRRRQRGIRFDIDDGGQAVALAGTPPGWLGVAQHVVEEDGMNINRRGVVFVQGLAGRDLERLERKVSAASRAVYDSLLELAD